MKVLAIIIVLFIIFLAIAFFRGGEDAPAIKYPLDVAESNILEQPTSQKYVSKEADGAISQTGGDGVEKDTNDTPVIGSNWSNSINTIGSDGFGDALDDGRRIYSCTGNSGGSVYAGEMMADDTSCTIGKDGAESKVPFNSYLKAGTYHWSVKKPTAPVLATPEGAPPQYVCRGSIAGNRRFGRVDLDAKCHFGADGTEYIYGAGDFDWLGAGTPAFRIPEVADGWSDKIADMTATGFIGSQLSTGEVQIPCVAQASGELIPGKTQLGWNTCNVAYQHVGQPLPLHSYLKAGDYYWAANMPAKPVVGGTLNTTNQLICRAKFEDGAEHIGRYDTSDNACHIELDRKDNKKTTNIAFLSARA